MKPKVEGSSPLSSVLTLLLYLSTLFHRVLSLVCPALILVSPRSPCLPTDLVKRFQPLTLFLVSKQLQASCMALRKCDVTQ